MTNLLQQQYISVCKLSNSAQGLNFELLLFLSLAIKIISSWYQIPAHTSA